MRCMLRAQGYGEVSRYMGGSQWKGKTGDGAWIKKKIAFGTLSQTTNT